MLRDPPKLRRALASDSLLDACVLRVQALKEDVDKIKNEIAELREAHQSATNDNYRLKHDLESAQVRMQEERDALVKELAVARKTERQTPEPEQVGEWVTTPLHSNSRAFSDANCRNDKRKRMPRCRRKVIRCVRRLIA